MTRLAVLISNNAVLATLLIGLSAPLARAEIPRVPEPPVRIETRARPIEQFLFSDPGRRRFGQLEFRGGMELTSSYRHFGGFSSIRLRSDGARFLALSDEGRWLRGRIVYEGIRPVGIAEAEMAPILGPDGKPLGARRWFDTELLAEDGGTVYVGIERVNQIVKFDFGRHGLLARGQPIPLPPEIKSLPYNKGLEALVFIPRGGPLGGTLLAISERGLDPAGNILGFLIGGPSPGIFTVRRTDNYDVTDAALLPDGDLLILERRASLLQGLGMRIRRVAHASIKPGALLDGPVLIEADLGFQIDNMEGLSVHQAGDDVVLTLISDDNFSVLQRTILLQFTLVEP